MRSRDRVTPFAESIPLMKWYIIRVGRTLYHFKGSLHFIVSNRSLTEESSIRRPGRIIDDLAGRILFVGDGRSWGFVKTVGLHKI